MKKFYLNKNFRTLYLSQHCLEFRKLDYYLPDSKLNLDFFNRYTYNFIFSYLKIK